MTRGEKLLTCDGRDISCTCIVRFYLKGVSADGSILSFCVDTQCPMDDVQVVSPAHGTCGTRCASGIALLLIKVVAKECKRSFLHVY